ncbi:endonuclease [Candidatus Parcubacteria bacterium]|nr:MAG: endonuclease [Candidatus Parcubacteria bacterium]
MYNVYILQSIQYGRYYIGHTNNLVDRLHRHNKGYVKSTKKFVPWKLIYFENYNTKSEACMREIEIKSYKGGIKFKKILGLWND